MRRASIFLGVSYLIEGVFASIGAGQVIQFEVVAHDRKAPSLADCFRRGSQKRCNNRAVARRGMMWTRRSSARRCPSGTLRTARLMSQPPFAMINSSASTNTSSPGARCREHAGQAADSTSGFNPSTHVTARAIVAGEAIRVTHRRRSRLHAARIDVDWRDS
jgi:hypothetical protein